MTALRQFQNSVRTIHRFHARRRRRRQRRTKKGRARYRNRQQRDFLRFKVGLRKNFNALELAIVHHLYARRGSGQNLIKEDATKPRQNIVGWDANTLYLSAAVQQQPCVGAAQKSAKVKKIHLPQTWSYSPKQRNEIIFLQSRTAAIETFHRGHANHDHGGLSTLVYALS